MHNLQLTKELLQYLGKNYSEQTLRLELTWRQVYVLVENLLALKVTVDNTLNAGEYEEGEALSDEELISFMEESEVMQEILTESHRSCFDCVNRNKEKFLSDPQLLKLIVEQRKSAHEG